jgi:amino acid transporter
MSNNELIFTRKSSGLVKGLSWLDVFILVIAAPAGSGILYYSVSTASTYPGGHVGLSFFLGMLIILPIIFLAAVSSSMIPRSGSLYVFISRVVNPGMGFITAVLFFLGYTLSIGVVAFVVTQVIGGILVNAGMAGNIELLKNFGQALQNPYWSAVGGTFLVLLTWIIVLKGIRAFRTVMRILFGITVIAALFTVIYFFITSQSSGAELFNRVWGDNAYQDIMQLAANKGWSPPAFSWSSTFSLLLVVLFSYGGLELISYASGEISQEKRKIMRGYMIAWLTLAFIYIIIAFSVVSAFGKFIGAYDFVFKNHPDALKTIMPAISPSIPFYISSIIPNAWLGIIISLSISLWLVTTMIPYFFAPSRLIFALAMDRAIPESMADVNSKTGAPTKASHITLVFALLGVFFNLLNVGTVLGTILFCALFVYWLYGLSAILLPYRKPELYSKSPIQKSIFNIPVISIVGALAFGIGWFVIFIAAKGMSMDIIITLSIFIAVVMILYLFKLQKNKQENVNIDQIYNQLPPE